MSDINRVNLVGRLTRDPEIRQIPSGTSVATFSIAVNKTWIKDNEKQEEVSYFNCVVWGKGGEAVARYAKKGQRIAVDGKLQQKRWQDKDDKPRNAVEIIVDTFQFLSFNNDGESSGGQQSPDNQSPETFTGDDDIPF